MHRFHASLGLGLLFGLAAASLTSPTSAADGRGGGQVRPSEVEIAGVGAVALELEPSSVVTPRTRFVLGSGREHRWNPDRVRGWRGTVQGRPDSRVFLVETASGRSGYVDLDGTRHWISTRGSRGGDAISTRSHGGGLPPGVSLCGCGESHHDHAQPPLAASGAAAARETTRVIELAVETDHELYSLFNDADATIDYIVELYSAVSDVFQRDVDVRIELVYSRIWQTPDDLFNQPDPLQAFRQYWNQNMQSVSRDVAQFLSGRRDLPYGGVAYLSALCGNYAYSVVGYVIGRIPDLSIPDVYNYDVPVCAHELGHNFGSSHTHSYGLDDCFNLSAPPQRGTIMGYCSQSVSGGNANTDLRFHTYVQDRIREYLQGIPCDHRDCNGNGIDDADEIATGAAADSNGNGVPDDCEDCDGDGILDDAEIAAGAPDVDGDFVPDDCQTDCNGNGVPDTHDVAIGTSADLDHNRIPDECEADCDGDGVADYLQLMADMSLDLDRNLVLDSCEDCDDDGVIDVVALGAAGDVWVGSHSGEAPIRRFHAVTGVLTGLSDPEGMIEANDVLVVPDGTVVVSNGADGRLVRFDRFGNHLGDVGADAPAAEPAGLAVGPTDGMLYVADRAGASVRRYNLKTNAFVDEFVAAGSGGLAAPFGLAFGADGDLFVNGGDGQVRRYQGSTGAFLVIFVTFLDNGGLLSPRGMLFKPDGNLLVASQETSQVLEFDGSTGAFVRQFNRGGTDAALTMDEPWGLRLGVNGNVYVSRHHVDPNGANGSFAGGGTEELHVNSSRIYEFDVDSGNFVRSYVLGHDTGMWAPTGFDFLPSDGFDCNGNRVPDACDIASGRSRDANGDGIPDECGGGLIADLDHDGRVAGSDLATMLGNWLGSGVGDLDNSGIVDGSDLAQLLGSWTG